VLRRPLLAAALVALLLIPTGAGAESTADFVSLTPSRTAAGAVRAAGKVAFQGEPFVVATDAGDVSVPAADIGELRITAGVADVVFEMEIANALPAGPGAVPGVLHYIWEFAVGGQESQLRALNTDAQALSPGEWSYTLETCAPDPQTGQGTCSGAAVQGSYADGVLTFVVPRAGMGLDGGETIRGGTGGAYVSYGAAGVVWGAGGVLLADQAMPKTFTMPDLEVAVAALGAGGEVLEVRTPSLTASGAFSNLTFSATGITALRGVVSFDGVTDTIEVPVS
jgi:hypothetical protein